MNSAHKDQSSSLIRATLVAFAVLGTGLNAPDVTAAMLKTNGAIANDTTASKRLGVLNIANGQVNGWNVNVVFHAGGRFVDNGNGNWVELGNDGARFNFVEMQRDDWSVYLNDPSRNLQIQLDLHRRQILWGQNNGPRSPLYNITDAAGTVGQIGTAVSQTVVEYNCNEGIPMTVAFTQDGNRSTATVTHDGFAIGDLAQVPSGSGNAYSNGQYQLFTKGNEAILQWNGITDVCRSF